LKNDDGFWNLLRPHRTLTFQNIPKINRFCGAEITNGSYLSEFLAKYMPISIFQWGQNKIIAEDKD
jgi:hypothetical protein